MQHTTLVQSLLLLAVGSCIVEKAFSGLVTFSAIHLAVDCHFLAFLFTAPYNRGGM